MNIDSGEPGAALFPLGLLRVDDDVHDVLAMNRQGLEPMLRRHVNGDWGDVTQGLRGRNDAGISREHWLKSLYVLEDGCSVIGIRTNAARTETHIRVEYDEPQGLQR